MRRPPYRLTLAADHDIQQILEFTEQQFGTTQHEAYARIIERALTLISHDPERAGTRDRSELAEGLRSFHLASAARRRGAAAHVVYYLERASGRSRYILVIRILHESMEPSLHFLRED